MCICWRTARRTSAHHEFLGPMRARRLTAGQCQQAKFYVTKLRVLRACSRSFCIRAFEHNFAGDCYATDTCGQRARILAAAKTAFWCGGRSLADARQGRQGKKTVKFAKMASAKRFWIGSKSLFYPGGPPQPRGFARRPWPGKGPYPLP